MKDKQIKVRKAARALSRGNLVNAYGHCSMRLDKTSFLVCRAGPMGTIQPGEDGTVVSVQGPLPEGVLGEVRVHQQIYKRRADVGAVCRVLPPNVLALSALGISPKARHGFGAFFAPAPPLWTDTALLRSEELAAAVAEKLGDRPAIILRGNGAVTAGETIEQAVTLAWYLEDAARVELVALSSGLADHAPTFTDEESRNRVTWSGNTAERMWDFLTFGDPE